MDILPKKGILLAFGELFLKSKSVRDIFQKALVRNISLLLKKEDINFKIYSFHERIFIETKNVKKARERIKNVFGIAWYSEAMFFDKISLEEFFNFFSENYQNWLKRGDTFAIRLKKDKKIIKKSSEEIIRRLAEPISGKVNLSKPKKEIFVELRKNGIFLYFKKKKGAGGLPVGTGGKVLALISGGIDSPAAAYLMAKRGVENVWLHFHSFPLLSKTSIEKTKELARAFLNYQPNLKIYFLPFHKIQAEIKLNSPPKYRILLYRRAMLQIAEKIAKKENCEALVTGESLGQVSSQTLTNMSIIEQNLKIPVFRPLIGMDKEDIIKLAKKIKTYQISIKPQEDCCTLFVPKRASAKGNLKRIQELEKNLNLKKAIKEIFKDIKIEKV